MRRFIFIFLILLAGCAEKRWVCYVDRNADSKCIKGDCIEMTDYMNALIRDKKECQYGLMRIFPLKEAFLHANNPPTDINKCRDYADGENK